jgi:hypothetical protein
MKLSERGYIFGLGAFRRYKEITGGDISHFEESLKPPFKIDAKGKLILDENEEPIPHRSIDELEASYRWVVMLKCANDVYVATNGGDSYSVDQFEVWFDQAEQSEQSLLIDKYLDASYLGKKMRDYYGISDNKKEDKNSKKKPSQQAKQQS